jgi:hypothetical protein
MTTGLIGRWCSPVNRLAARKRFTYCGGTSMATQKKTTSKKGIIRDLPKAKKELTSDQAKVVKGGIIFVGGRTQAKP